LSILIKGDLEKLQTAVSFCFFDHVSLSIHIAAKGNIVNLRSTCVNTCTDMDMGDEKKCDASEHALLLGLHSCCLVSTGCKAVHTEIRSKQLVLDKRHNRRVRKAVAFGDRLA